VLKLAIGRYLGGETLFRLTVSRRRTGFKTGYPGTDPKFYVWSRAQAGDW
jgi:hypothetical protein